MRITTPGGKVAAITVGVVLALLVTLLAAAVAVPFGSLIAAASVVAFVFFCGRTFRGTGEPLAPPRPWWRLTARPTAGVVLAVLFGAQPLASLLLPALVEPRPALPTVVGLLVAAAFAHSSYRLSRFSSRED